MTIVELAASPADVPRRVREAVEPPLRAAVAGLPGETREVVELGLRSRDFSTAALTVLSAEAVGDADVTALAVAMELTALHEQLHADLMNPAATGGPRSEFGYDRVVTAADTVLCMAFARVTAAEAMALNGTLMSVVDGYVQELEMADRADVDLSEHLGVAAAKHSSLTALACELGALATGASRRQADHLREFGDDVGLARRHVDDVLSLPVDLARHRRSLPVVAVLAAGGDPRTQAEEGRRWSLQQAELLLARALDHLHQAATGEVDELAGLAHAVTIARCAPVVPVQPTVVL
ncbi:geranylgeranyl diphosphate synthase, type I [Lentzea fradiae]|uniref:Geranylgeranyl diphosphate synthase, type I n=1 Tax=Lentzea fradiae TaxID=200378 RepID=A0A1G7ZBV5_9PSEU|nr:class 1 isoprenoid biosynthesis enzyme [Lentzea fradiae]SDH06164.1 geranylgeranyl diphosphate synthase, type I [Lentzea fradiae]